MTLAVRKIDRYVDGSVQGVTEMNKQFISKFYVFMQEKN